MNTPVNPSFTILKWGVRESTLHGHVSLMTRTTVHAITLQRCTVHSKRAAVLFAKGKRWFKG